VRKKGKGKGREGGSEGKKGEGKEGSVRKRLIRIYAFGNRIDLNVQA